MSTCSWLDEAIPMLRGLINDTDYENAEYDDGRLEELLYVAAKLMLLEVTFTSDYSVTVTTSTVSPNPCDQTDGDDFIGFATLKAACMTDINAMRIKAATAGLKARCGPVEMQTLQQIPGFQALIDVGPCKAYEDLKEEQKWNISIQGTAKAILVPFIHNDYHAPRGGGDHHTDFF